MGIERTDYFCVPEAARVKLGFSAVCSVKKGEKEGQSVPLAMC